MPDYSNYRGVYIEDVDGYLYTEDEWDGSKTVNGIAVLTDNCRFVMALEDAYASTCSWGSSGTTVSGTTTTTNRSVAMADYDGEAQTTAILSELGNSSRAAPAAYYCRAFTFPNGKKGYLGAAGEWKAAIDSKAAIVSALSKCGGSTMDSYYLTSTQYSSDYCWHMEWETEILISNYKGLSRSVRAFTTLKSDDKEQE